MDVLCQSIRAHQQRVTGQHYEIFNIRINIFFRAKSFEDDVLHFRVLSLLAREIATTHLLHYQRMVLRELLDHPLPDEVDAAVTYVGDGKSIALDQRSHQG